MAFAVSIFSEGFEQSLYPSTNKKIQVGKYYLGILKSNFGIIILWINQLLEMLKCKVIDWIFGHVLLLLDVCFHKGTRLQQYAVVEFLNSTTRGSPLAQFKDKLQEWTEHWGTDHWKFRTSRDNKKNISTSFEHLKKCINFQNYEGVAQLLSLPRPF